MIPIEAEAKLLMNNLLIGYRAAWVNVLPTLLLSLLMGTSLAQALPPDSGLLQTAQLQEHEPSVHSAAAYYRLGVSLHQQRRIDEAVEAYQTAIHLNPALDSAYINLSLLFISIGQLQQAEALLQQVLQLPDRAEVPASIHAIAHYNLAIIHNRQGDAIAALEEVQETLAIAPDFSRAQQLWEQLSNP